MFARRVRIEGQSENPEAQYTKTAVLIVGHEVPAVVDFVLEETEIINQVCFFSRSFRY